MRFHFVSGNHLVEGRIHVQPWCCNGEPGGRRRGDDNVDLSVVNESLGRCGRCRRGLREEDATEYGLETSGASIRDVVRAARARKAPRMAIPTIERRIGERIALENAAMVLDTPPFPGHESKMTREGWIENGSKSDCGCDSARILESEVSCHDPPGVGLLSMKGR